MGGLSSTNGGACIVEAVILALNLNSPFVFSGIVADNGRWALGAGGLFLTELELELIQLPYGTEASPAG